MGITPPFSRREKGAGGGDTRIDGEFRSEKWVRIKKKRRTPLCEVRMGVPASGN